ncbi:MAG: hypothetical protein GY953_35980 [bacterium]|nr:hypothetical protein [bacterium]
MTKSLCRGLCLIAAFVAFPALMCPEQHVTARHSYEHDLRVERLRTFLEDHGYPVEDLATDFVAAADLYELDWRLLPSISILESSGGKRYRRNNIFGWDSCNTGFPSVRDGIYHVASRLGESRLYRDKDLDGKLRTYNPYATYSARAKSVMRALGPVELIAAEGLHP